MSDSRIYDVGPGFVRAKECPDCFHTRCGEDCVCNCDAAHAEYEASFRKGREERIEVELNRLRSALQAAERERDEARAEVEAAGVWAQHIYKQCGLEPGTDASIIELVSGWRAALCSIQHASSGFERCTEVVGESLVALRSQLEWINARAREALGK